MNKLCRSCNTSKPINQFKKHVETADKLYNHCRECVNAKQKEYRIKNKNTCTLKYEKTKSGFLVRCYRNMKSRVGGIQKREKYIGLPLLDKDVFYSWSINDESFNNLFSNWEANNYTRKLSPSIDRIDSKKGYTLDNIRWITHSENSALGNISRFSKAS